ncbi:hypothetical protein [Spirochaeta africana]|uniref:Uncharacterized protein n=1 Tax=Spirochaeta africana (strain ATCC 700263 / DSM 8902 / Z-7692) TaxID=889378 RepID=H9UFQ0_SPIAZ|nr:hypothetical protein [Spirochaeta africana]AFG36343.1 hypothetical protein Spiaf_0235 [Spirochaeta africana DSM 8902]
MTLFRIKGMHGIETYMEILREEDDGFHIHIHSSTPYGESDSEEYISSDLFDSCLRTGYLIPVPLPAHQIKPLMRTAG